MQEFQNKYVNYILNEDSSQLKRTNFMLRLCPIKLKDGPYRCTCWIWECSSCTILLGLAWSSRVVQSWRVWGSSIRPPGRIDLCLQEAQMYTSQARSKLLQNYLAYFGMCILLQRIWGLPKCNDQVCKLHFNHTATSLRNFHSLRLQMCKQWFKKQFCLHITNMCKYVQKKHRWREQKNPIF